MTAPATGQDLLAAFAARHEARQDKLKITHPTAEELAVALAELETETRRCGRCYWVCQNPHPGMPQFQMVMHAVRHRELEAQDDAELTYAFQMSTVVWDEWAHNIAYAELRRRGIDTLAIPRLAWQTYA